MQAVIKENKDKDKENLLQMANEKVERLQRKYQHLKKVLEKEVAEGEEQLKRERDKTEKNRKKLSEDRLVLLQEENKAQMTLMLVRQEIEQKEKEGGCGRKRKRGADEHEVSTEKQPSVPECPVCLDQMAPPTKIFQFSNGHHICASCWLLLKPCICPKCRRKIIGRATDMENFLREFCPPASTIFNMP